KNKYVDTPRYKNDNQSGQFGNQRIVTVIGARETVGKQADLLEDMDEEVDEQELEAHYSYMAKIQEVLQADSDITVEPLTETDQNTKECHDERDALANLIANLTLDTEENKKILKQLKKANTSLTYELEKHKGKEIVKPITPPSASEFDENSVSVQTEQADLLEDMDEEVDKQELEAHYSYMAKIQEVLQADSDTTVEPLTETDQNTKECHDERDALANLIANLTLDTEENKKILKQLKKANTSLTHELEKYQINLEETTKALGETTSSQDSCLIALQNKQTELEKYIAFNDRIVYYDKLQTMLNGTLGLLAQKDIDIKEGLNTKAYEILVVKQKHDELVKQSLLTKSNKKGLLKEKSHVIKDLQVKEDKDIDKMILMEKQLKFLNEIVYKRNQSIQTIHVLAPKGSTYNGRPNFPNPM
nr:hypothetical protein [Tanacetum cinerariifolium]